MNWRLIYLFFLLSLCSPSFASDQILSEGLGCGPSSEDALIIAKKDAVRKVVETFLTSQIEIDSFSAKEESCISKIAGSLKSWEILSETKNSSGLFQLKIKANISKNLVHKELLSSQILIEAMNKPRVLVLVSEENCGSWEPQSQSAEKTIHKFLGNSYYFDLVSPDITAPIKGTKQRMLQICNNLSVAVATGTQNGAEVLILGTAVSRRSENPSVPAGMVSVSADVTLKAINCTTGRLICSGSSHAQASDTSHIIAGKTAIENASDSVIRTMLDPVIKDWQGQLSIGISINMNIKEVKTVRQKKVIVQTLERISSISVVREQAWNPQSAVLEIVVYYRGNPNDLYDKLDGYKLVSGGGSLRVTGIKGQNVTIAAQPM